MEEIWQVILSSLFSQGWINYCHLLKRVTELLEVSDPLNSNLVS